MVALACVALVGLMFKMKALAAFIGVVAMLATPFAWAASTLDAQYRGSALDATAGPVEVGLAGGGKSPLAQEAKQISTYLVTQDGQLNPINRAVLAYVNTTQGSDMKYVFATDDWLTAQPYVAGARVLPMGGFSGQVAYPTLAQVQTLVRDGRLKYFLLDAPGTFNLGFLFGTVGGGPTLRAVDAWVRTSCVAIPSTAYGVPTADAAQVLYRCSAA